MAAVRVLSSVAAMSTRHPTHRVEVSFVGPPPVRQITRASGVTGVEIDGLTVRCVVAGSFQPFLEALHGHEVIALSSMPAMGAPRYEGDYR